MLISSSSLELADCLVSRRVRAEILEIEEADLAVLLRNETYLAVLYHDNSKVLLVKPTSIPYCNNDK